MGAPRKPTAEVKSDKLAAALRHAERGWCVFPVHGIRAGKCTCGTDCKSAGKHPRTANGLKDATTDVDTITRCWNKWPDANIGIATGSVSGILVLDIDPRNGGDKTLKRLLRGNALPSTPTCRTGGGGLHIYLALSPEISSRSRNALLRGLDIKGDGGYVIAPVSVHKSGQTYKWVSGLSPSKAKLAPIPSWLAKQLSENRRRNPASTGEAGKPILEGQRNSTLVQMAGRLRRARLTPEEIGATLSSINERRCDPPLSEREIQAIATSAAKWEPGTGSSPYSAREEGIFGEKVIGDDVVPVRLVNFDARIVTDISEDDGVEVRRTYEIQSDLLGRRKTFPVPAAQFPTMNWATENLGARAIVSAGMGLRDHARCAIQELSTNVAERIVFAHSGWRKYRGRFVYLHSDGAIGEGGNITNIEVKLPTSLDDLRFPAPPNGEALRRAVRASLDFLKMGPRAVTYPLHASIYRAPLGSCDFSEHLAGETGVGKTVVAALCQQHYGAGFGERNLPGSWSSTANANEGLAFTTKDTLIVLDDFAPTGTRADVARSNKDADRIFRAQGNSSGRQRMKSDSTLRNPKPPRGLILSTGEDVPRGRSLRARVLIIELSPNALDWKRVTQCQQDASEGLYAQAMAGYLQWLAPRYEAIKKKMPARISELRAEAASSAQHKRTPEIIANLWLGLTYFLRFAVEVGAISKEKSSELQDIGWDALGTAAQKQNRHQKAEDPVDRFLELIGSALSMGRAYLADAENGASRTAKGDCIGWLDDGLVLLDPEAAFATAQKLAQEQGEFLSVAQKTLWKRMDERGVLAESEANRNLVRKTIANRRKYVLSIQRQSLGISNQNRANRAYGAEV